MFYQEIGERKRGYSVGQHCLICFCHRFSKALFFYCPGKGKVYFCARQRNSCVMGNGCFRCPWAWLAPESRQPASARHLLIQLMVLKHAKSTHQGKLAVQVWFGSPLLHPSLPPHHGPLASSASSATSVETHQPPWKLTHSRSIPDPKCRRQTSVRPHWPGVDSTFMEGL